MEEQESVSQTIEVPSKGASTEGHGGGGGVMDVSVPMMVLTWLTFIIVTVLLYKVAWKPILKALETREESIRKALDEAEKARSETAASEVQRRQMMQEAEATARKLMDDARLAAEHVARQAEATAREQGQAMVADARREIESATQKARVQLRHEAAELAVALAGKCVARNLDTASNRVLVQELMKEI